MPQHRARSRNTHGFSSLVQGSLVAIVTAAGAVLLAACGSTSTTSVGPTPLKCELALQTPADTVSGNGATRTVTVGAPPECSWRATAQVTWITRVTPANGQGNGSLTFDVTANTGAARSGTLLIGEQSVTVNQESLCAFTVNPTTHNNVPATASSRTSAVTAGPGCTWSSSTTTPWLTLTAGSGTGSGNATFNVAANTGPQWTGTVTIAGRAVTVTQLSGCTYSISPPSRSFNAAGGTQAVNVTAPTGCTWTATVPAGNPWITIVSGSSGSGNGVVNYTVAPVIGTRRTATLTIATQPHSVTQN